MKTLLSLLKNQFVQSVDGLFYTLDNMRSLIGNPQNPIFDPVTQASVAGTQAINYSHTFVSGTNQLTAIKVPAGFRGVICLIPTGAFTGATGGTLVEDGTNDTIPIGKAFTAVAAKALYLVTDGNLFYPSY